MAILDGDHGHRNFIPGLEGRLAQAQVSNRGRIFSLCIPMHNLIASVCYVQLKYAMGIGPKPSCNRPLDSDSLVRVICRIAVVCGKRQGKH